MDSCMNYPYGIVLINIASPLERVKSPVNWLDPGLVFVLPIGKQNGYHDLLVMGIARYSIRLF